MRRLKNTLLIAAAAVLVHGVAEAQSPYGPRFAPSQSAFRRPAISPYVNLLQGADNGVSNYFTQVRPRLNQGLVNTHQTSRIQSLQHQVAGAVGSAQSGSPGIRQTGHITTYRNFSHFYPSLSRRNSAGGGGYRR